MIPSGTRIGSYEVVGPLGAGGMGEVYRARDVRLGRDVALKVLAPSLAGDPQHLSRFEHESRLVAALNHPNIVALFDVGLDSGVAYIVTELVEGASVGGATFPIRKVADIGAQIAEALAAAHAAGVTHRDVKPQNVMLTRDGRVKLLDFGVARLNSHVAALDVTLAHTGVHSVVGTPGYMAPEQVRGEHVDSRTDIFGVGALLHELLSGAPPFIAGTAADVMTASLRDDPPDLPATVPPALRQIVRRCLEKNPEERFQSARDLAFALRQFTTASTADTAPATRARPRTRTASVLWPAAAGFAIALTTMGAIVQRWGAAQDAAIDPIQLTRLTSDKRNEIDPAVSPDGRSLAYLRVGGGVFTDLFVRPLDSGETLTLARSNTAISGALWSTDGNQVCYTDLRRDLWCVSAAGGGARRALSNAFLPRLSPDGTNTFFIRVDGGQPWLFRASSEGGEPQRLGTTALPNSVHSLSPVSPDGTSLVVAFDGGRAVISLPDGIRGREWNTEPGVHTQSIAWLPDSRHLVVAEMITSVVGARLVIEDTESVARRLVLHTADDIQSVTTTSGGTALVYASGPVERDLMEYSGSGAFVRTVADSSLLEGFPSWAPTGDRFVYRTGGPGQSDTLWLSTTTGSAAVVPRVGTNQASLTPISPDGTRVAYVDASGIHVVAVSGGRSVRVLASTAVSRPGLCWSADGEWIWYSEGPTRLAKVPSGGGEPVMVQAAPGPLLDCSPDGRWLIRRGQTGWVLTSTEGGADREIASADRYASRAATSVQFGAGGKVVYFLGLDRRTIDEIDVESGRTLRSVVFDVPPEDRIDGFAFSPDGRRVLLVTGGNRNDIWMVEGFARPAAWWKRWFTHWESPRDRPFGR